MDLSIEQYQTKKGFLEHQVREILWKKAVYMQYLHITTINTCYLQISWKRQHYT